MYYLQHYKINFEKVKTTEDVIRILKALDISIELNNQSVNEIKDLLVLVDKQSGKPV
jgi:hypothetical protein